MALNALVSSSVGILPCTFIHADTHMYDTICSTPRVNHKEDLTSDKATHEGGTAEAKWNDCKTSLQGKHRWTHSFMLVSACMQWMLRCDYALFNGVFLHDFTEPHSLTSCTYVTLTGIGNHTYCSIDNNTPEQDVSTYNYIKEGVNDY